MRGEGGAGRAGLGSALGGDGEQADRLAAERLVDVAPASERDRGRLGVRALDQPEGAGLGQQHLEVIGRAVEVGLDAEADVRVGGAHLAVQVDRGLRVGASLHVDPDDAASAGGVACERGEVRGGAFAAEIEAEVRQLEGDVRGQASLPDAVEHHAVVVDDLRGDVGAGDVLAEAGEHGGDAGVCKLPGGAQRRVEILTRHEAAGRDLREAVARETSGEPVVAGGPEESAPYHVGG